MGGAGITGMMFRQTTGGDRNLLDPSEPLKMPVTFEAVVIEVVLGAWNASLAARVKATTLAAVYQSKCNVFTLLLKFSQFTNRT